jgi:hypothetical protein
MKLAQVLCEYENAPKKCYIYSEKRQSGSDFAPGMMKIPNLLKVNVSL